MSICPSCKLEFSERSFSDLCPACDCGTPPSTVRAERERDELRIQMIAIASADKNPPGLPWVLHKRLSSAIDLWSAEKFNGCYTITDLTRVDARIMARDLTPALADWLVENGLARWVSGSGGSNE